ncbi:uncharacterized protein VTP21DRAFT_4907 [Calcarisporiella thermophila]|uniref:uncharacterized protein n=1 Tax=Calcarisporiella thermophila TaxID=911321 RepID=UPI0037420792
MATSGMDLIVQLPRIRTGFDIIVVFVDQLTKMAHFVPTTTTISAPELARIYFDTIFRYHGLPEANISDRDPRFISNFWNALFRILDTKLLMSSAYHPQNDGQTGRTNRTLEQRLRAYVSYKQDNWDKLLPYSEFAYNNARQDSTNLIIIATDNLNAAKLHQAQFANEQRRNLEFQGGDKVLLSTKNFTPANQARRPTKKLQHKYTGPFEIAEAISTVAYRLKLPNTIRIHPVFHVSLLKAYHENPADFPERIAPPPPPVEWTGYLDSESTWEPLVSLTNAQESIQEYEASFEEQRS